MSYGRRAAIAKVVMAVFLLGGGVSAQEAPIEVVALGDSLTQGYGLVAEDGFVPQLQAWLQAQGVEAQVVNAGVSGDTTAGGLARVAWSLTPQTDAMIVALGGNDLLRGIAPETARANLEGILKEATARALPVLLVGMEAPGNYGPEYKQAFDAIYPDLAGVYGADLAPSFFEGLEVEGDIAAAQAFMQADGIHPNAQGVARIVEALGPRVLALLEPVN
ncbi:arylesterase [Roseobacteraceae bacterium S113]